VVSFGLLRSRTKIYLVLYRLNYQGSSFSLMFPDQAKRYWVKLENDSVYNSTPGFSWILIMVRFNFALKLLSPSPNISCFEQNHRVSRASELVFTRAMNFK
jgi:hypothetical protein